MVSPNEGLGRGTRRQDQRVVLQLDMVVGENLRWPRDAADAGAVDQRAGMDQHAVDQQGVVGRHEQVAPGHAVGQGPGADVDGIVANRIGEHGVDDPSEKERVAALDSHDILEAAGVTIAT